MGKEFKQKTSSLFIRECIQRHIKWVNLLALNPNTMYQKDIKNMANQMRSVMIYFNQAIYQLNQFAIEVNKVRKK